MTNNKLGLFFRIKSDAGKKMTKGRAESYSAGDGSERGQPLNVIGVAAPESIALGVLSPLQHKLLALVGGVLVAHPAVEKAGDCV